MLRRPSRPRTRVRARLSARPEADAVVVDRAGQQCRPLPLDVVRDARGQIVEGRHRLLVGDRAGHAPVRLTLGGPRTSLGRRYRSRSRPAIVPPLMFGAAGTSPLRQAPAVVRAGGYCSACWPRVTYWTASGPP
jgi:hypothetical protein